MALIIPNRRLPAGRRMRRGFPDPVPLQRPGNKAAPPGYAHPGGAWHQPGSRGRMGL